MKILTIPGLTREVISRSVKSRGIEIGEIGELPLWPPKAARKNQQCRERGELGEGGSYQVSRPAGADPFSDSCHRYIEYIPMYTHTAYF